MLLFNFGSKMVTITACKILIYNLQDYIYFINFIIFFTFMFLSFILLESKISLFAYYSQYNHSSLKTGVEALNIDKTRLIPPLFACATFPVIGIQEKWEREWNDYCLKSISSASTSMFELPMMELNKKKEKAKDYIQY